MASVRDVRLLHRSSCLGRAGVNVCNRREWVIDSIDEEARQERVAGTEAYPRLEPSWLDDARLDFWTRDCLILGLYVWKLLILRGFCWLWSISVLTDFDGVCDVNQPWPQLWNLYETNSADMHRAEIFYLNHWLDCFGRFDFVPSSSERLGRAITSYPTCPT